MRKMSEQIGLSRTAVANCLAGAALGLKRSVLMLALAAIPAAAQDVPTYHNDNARTGQNLTESILTTSNVNVNTFGKLFILPADGKVDAEPLYMSNLTIGATMRNVVFVATEHDSVYAYDADTGALLWQVCPTCAVSMLRPGETPSDDRNCSQVTPEIGVTATPVIDRSSGPHGTIYVVAMSKDSSSVYHQRLHALDVTTGAEETAFGGPVDIQATYSGSGAEGNGTTLTFDAKQHKARASLLLLNNVVYVGWSSHCDHDPYTAWIMGYDKSTLVQNRLLNITPNGNEGSIWQSGAGMAADLNNIYFLTANGTADTTLNELGFPIHGDYGNAFMKLSTSGALAVADYFNMFNTVSESNADQDLGSGGALVLPDITDANNMIHHLTVGAGKDQNIYLLDRDNMGKFNSTTNNIYQQVTTPLSGREYGMPAYFNNAIYYGASGDRLKMFPFMNARLQAASSTTTNSFPYPGATPSISANGAANGIVWATENTSTAVLHAYDATNLATELYNSNQAPNNRDHFGAGNKFITPMIANGKVYVGTTTGVAVFGLMPGASLQPTSLSFAGQLVTTTSSAKSITLSNTATSSLTISSIATTGNFAVSTGTNACGSTLAAHSSCLIYVTFTPTSTGTRSGTLSITDNASGSPQTAALSGTGTDFSVSVSRSPGQVPSGGSTTVTMTVSPLSGFTGTVALSCTGAPSTVTCAFSPNPVTLNGSSQSSTVTITTGVGGPTAMGTYKLTLTGVSGPVSHSTTVLLKVH